MNKILDYEQIMNKLDTFKNTSIIERKELCTTKFGYKMRYFTYGKGKYHVILTAGTHSAELITIDYILHLMEKLSKENFIDENKFTLHFIPLVNPEGNIIITSAIRTLLKREATCKEEQMLCNQYYQNAKLEDIFVEHNKDKDIKLQNWMFRYATYKSIPKEHMKLRNNVKKIIENGDFPKGILIQWTSNGSGIDLNSNVENSKYLNETLNKVDIYNNLRLNTIKKNIPGPIGCPTNPTKFEYEKENQALINFYTDLSKNNKVVGSLIYHSCGAKIVFIDKIKEKNPWKDNYDEKYINYNVKVAEKFRELTAYEYWENAHYKSFDALLKTIVPGTLLIELGKIRANPLSQFIENNNIYSDTIRLNDIALVPVFEEMVKQYNIFYGCSN